MASRILYSYQPGASVSDTKGSGRRRFSRRPPSRRERLTRLENQESALPQGFVTLCFTDIEGSTRLMHALGDRYADVCERHFEAMRPAWEAFQGKEVSFAGDSVLVAFADPTAAVVGTLGTYRWHLKLSSSLTWAARSWPSSR